MKTRKPKTRLFAGGITLGMILPFSSFATTLAPNFTLEGRLLNAAGTAASSDTVDFTVGVYSSSGTCLLYEQKITNVDLSQTDGFYRLSVGTNTGSASRTSSDPGKTIAAVFSNSSQIRADDAGTTNTCPGGYMPAAGDQRTVRVTVTSHSTGIPETLSPDLSISPVPHATVAESVQGLTPELLLQITGNSSPYVFNSSDLDKIFGPTGPGATAAADASTMHHHDSLYAKLTDSSSISLNSGAYLGLGSRASDPVGLGPTDAGKTWYDSTSNVVKYWDGTTVQTLGTGGGGSVTSVTATGGSPITIAGTASAPTVGISQASSVSNGYLSSADWLTFNNKTSSQWTTTGSDIYYNTGKVGIGTTSPNQKLEVSGNAIVTGRASFGSNTIGSGFITSTRNTGNNGDENLFLDNVEFGAGKTSVISFNTGGTGRARIIGGQDLSANSVLAFDTNNSEKVRIDSVGNVGIGTTNPSAKLEVTGDIGLTNTGTDAGVRTISINGSFRNILTLSTSSNGAGATGGQISLFGGAFAGGSVTLTAGNGQSSNGAAGNVTITGGNATNPGAGAVSLVGGNSTNGPGGNVYLVGGTSSTSTSGNVILGSTSAGVIRGNIGIGTTAPTQPLEVVTRSSLPFVAQKIRDYNDTTGMYLGSVSGGEYRYLAGQTFYNTAGGWTPDSSSAAIMNLHNGNVAFYTDAGLTAGAGYTPTERMRITTSGNVGIGTTAPTEKLDLGGGNISMGYQIVTTTCGSVPSCTSTCPAGKRVLGGGGDCTGSGMTITSTMPSGNNAWVVWLSGGNCSSGVFNVYAICANIR